MSKLNKESVIGISALLIHAANIDEIYSSVPDLDTFGGVPGSLVLPSRALGLLRVLPKWCEAFFLHLPCLQI